MHHCVLIHMVSAKESGRQIDNLLCSWLATLARIVWYHTSNACGVMPSVLPLSVE